MAAPKGNKFWELRSKHGRDKIFTEPETLLQAANEYFEYIDTNPLYKSEAKVVSLGQGEGSEVQIVDIPIKRPFTLMGLCLFLGVNRKYFIDFEQSLKENNKKDNDFSQVLTYIHETIYNQKFEGAASNIFNHSIIARDLGLVDKKDLTTKGQSFNKYDDWTDEQIKAELERLDGKTK
jgi:hypothetical protein